MILTVVPPDGVPTAGLTLAIATGERGAPDVPV